MSRRRIERNLTPRALDWACNGVPVYIRRRPVDGAVYATTFDFSKFVRDEPLETLRLPVGDITDIRAWRPEGDERVQQVIAKWEAAGADAS